MPDAIMEILLVCSGNTCRSPLAAAMLRARLADDPRLAHVRVSSAGTAAWDGAPASEGSYLVALERGLDLSSHRARMLTTQLIERADLILTMSDAHAVRVADLGGAGKVHSLAAWAGHPAGIRDVPDPYGGSVTVYRETAMQLDRLLEPVVMRLLTELAP
jgi:protein-tyrosine-phosphatase